MRGTIDRRSSLRIMALALLLGGLGQGPYCRAGTLYTTGPDLLQYGSDGVPSVYGSYADVDHFVLQSDSTVKQVRWSEWLGQGGAPTVVGWTITTNLVNGSNPRTGASNVVAQGTAPLAYTLTASGVQGGNDVYSSTFSVNVPLAAGTYYLWLATAGGSDTVGSPAWGYANQISGNAQQWINGSYWRGLSGDFSFEIDGVTSTAVPEPSSLVLSGIALAGAMAYLRTRRKKARRA